MAFFKDSIANGQRETLVEVFRKWLAACVGPNPEALPGKAVQPPFAKCRAHASDARDLELLERLPDIEACIRKIEAQSPHDVRSQKLLNDPSLIADEMTPASEKIQPTKEEIYAAKLRWQEPRSKRK
jgi:hypothetical protein